MHPFPYVSKHDIVYLTGQLLQPNKTINISKNCLEMKVRYKLRNCYTSEPSSLVAQMIKRLPTMWETQIQSLGREDLLEKEMATHSSILAWKIPWTEEPDRLQSIGSQSVGHDWLTSLSLSTYLKDSTTEKHSHCWQEKEWRWKGIVGGETLKSPSPVAEQTTSSRSQDSNFDLRKWGPLFLRLYQKTQL